MSSDIYKLTEYGLVAKFQQPCGCNAEGPGAHCEEGRRLYEAMSADSSRLFNEEITLKEADKTLNPWLTHLGA